ncbi:zinc protease PQQL-like [Gossypium australe]|uniref:Zinc protease PQQL-like n=1 Tax=Gossypium australe TaxID=47621 RepID=A0A5B6X830_9ROSI|nr:zinc protease PQQL-like [Gossypium australe]
MSRDVVRSPMVEAQCSVQLCFPVVLKNGTMVEEIHCVGFLSKLIETKIVQVLRFKHGQIYSACVSVFLGGNKPSRTGDVRGDVSINFSCDPEISSKLVDLTLDEVVHLQEEGPTDQDVSTVLEIEQRAHENGLQENYYWLERILRSYQSRIYSGDVGASFKIQDEGRSRVRETLTPSTAQSALRRILPYPCKKQYTVVILMPQASRFKLLRSLFKQNAPSRDAKVSYLLILLNFVMLILELKPTTDFYVGHRF